MFCAYVYVIFIRLVVSLLSLFFVDDFLWHEMLTRDSTRWLYLSAQLLLFSHLHIIVSFDALRFVCNENQKQKISHDVGFVSLGCDSDTNLHTHKIKPIIRQEIILYSLLILFLVFFFLHSLCELSLFAPRLNFSVHFISLLRV